MDKSPERKEKICLNCNTELVGRFCHKCGQENREPRESVGSFISHFFYDITHFDGKFFSTLKYLIRKPGFLSAEYLRGRRASYLHPIRMYIFTSAFFFIIFYWMYEVKNLDLNKATMTRQDSLDALLIKNQADSLIEQITTKNKNRSIVEVSMDSSRKSGFEFSPLIDKYQSKSHYDSLQKLLPPDKRDGWIKRRLILRSIALKQKYKNQRGELFKNIANKFIHTFPYLLFISLPLYALFLKLLYLRKKQFYYLDHIIWLLHLYIFSFLFLLVFFGISRLQEVTRWAWLDIIQGVMLLYGIFYAYKAMRNFYKQSRGKTLVKFIVLNLLALVSITFLFLFFLILTVYRV